MIVCFLTIPDPVQFTAHYATFEAGSLYARWHSQLHILIITSNEQSLLPSLGSVIGHSPGQSMCLPFLQKYVTSINACIFSDDTPLILYKRSILKSCGAYIDPSLTFLTFATER